MKFIDMLLKEIFKYRIIKSEFVLLHLYPLATRMTTAALYFGRICTRFEIAEFQIFPVASLTSR